ncbi:hypothetical protein D1641_18865, partial [Colidextribacter sp. OB.20]|nr:hypothetical protein [Colidextribacter sp. OB.20]
NRIADSANFNGIKLLDGSLESGAKEISVKGVDSTQVNAVQSVVTNDTALTTTGADAEEGDTYTFTVSLDNGKSYTATVKVEKYVDGDGNVSDTQVRLVNANGEVLTKKIAATAVDAGAVTDALIKDLKKSDLADQFQIEKSGTDKIQFTNLQAGDKTVPQINAFESTVKASTATTATITADKPDITTAGVDAGREVKASDITEYDGKNYDDAVFTINGKKFVLMTGNMEATGDAFMNAVAALGPDVTVLVGDKTTGTNGLDPNDENFEQNIAKIKEVTGLNVEANAAGDGIKLSLDPKAKGGLSLQIGDTSDSFNQLNVSVGDMHTKALGIDKIDIGTQAGA